MQKQINDYGGHRRQQQMRNQYSPKTYSGSIHQSKAVKKKMEKCKAEKNSTDAMMDQ